MSGRRARLLLLALLLLLCLSAARAQVGGEFADLEAYAARHPRDHAARRRLAQAYAERGFIEEATAQYLALLAAQPDDAELRKALSELFARQMPAWLPPKVADARPFRVTVLDVQLPAPEKSERVQQFRLLTTTDFAAHEGERRDQLHGWLFPRISYGYVWEPESQRWRLKLRVHHTGANGDVVQGALRTALALYLLAREYLQCDPTAGWNTPIDIWLAEGGDPSARTVGRDIYLYAVRLNRSPEEWLREVAHEYGHVSLPGVGGFVKTDDPWADGNLGELLFAKWLAAGQQMDWLPWPPAAAEAVARPEREKLMAAAPGQPDPARLAGTDEAARSYFLGLALRIEAAAGPRFLGEALARARRSRAPQVIAAAEQLAKERGVKLWP